MRLSELSTYLDEYLAVATTPDYSPALNGLQLESEREITHVAAAVDATQASIEAAIGAGAQVLLVHHGLFWDGNQPLTGRRYRRVKRAMEAGLAVYSAHLPLDVHPEVGNNAVLARALGLAPLGRFGDYKGLPLGVWGELDLSRETLKTRLERALGSAVTLVGGGPERIRRIGIVTGGAADMVGAARAAGLDAFITGEGAHHHYFDAMEGGINLYLGGHYATEVWGVRALAEHLADRFGLAWTFIDQPTGL